MLPYEYTKINANYLGTAFCLSDWHWWMSVAVYIRKLMGIQWGKYSMEEGMVQIMPDFVICIIVIVTCAILDYELCEDRDYFCIFIIRIFSLAISWYGNFGWN